MCGAPDVVLPVVGGGVVGGGVVGGGVVCVAAFTVTVATAVTVFVALDATSVKLVLFVGIPKVRPVSAFFSPLIVTDVAFVTVHFSSIDWPAVTVLGEVVIITVGAVDVLCCAVLWGDSDCVQPSCVPARRQASKIVMFFICTPEKTLQTQRRRDALWMAHVSRYEA